MTLKMILCTNTEGFIGSGNELIHSIPQDMAYFKEVTMGHTVIMGRKTWESIPAKHRPLPGRKNIIVSNTMVSIDNAVVEHQLDELLEKYAKSEEVAFVIGGGMIYDRAMEYVTEAHVTMVISNKEGDTKSPEFTPVDWELVSQSNVMKHNDLEFMFNVFRRKIKVQ